MDLIGLQLLPAKGCFDSFDKLLRAITPAAFMDPINP